jgi:hypothetical protein
MARLPALMALIRTASAAVAALYLVFLFLVIFVM